MAKRNASRQRPRANSVRRRKNETEIDLDKAPNIAAVYHAVAIERMLQDSDRNFDFNPTGMTFPIENRLSMLLIRVPGPYCMKIQLTPPAKSRLPKWHVYEISVAEASAYVAAEMDKLPESGFSLIRDFTNLSRELIPRL
jgi:hypothetical protein